MAAVGCSGQLETKKQQELLKNAPNRLMTNSRAININATYVCVCDHVGGVYDNAVRVN